jgi:hypothetical protein
MSDIQIPTFSNVGGGRFAVANAQQNQDATSGKTVLPEVIQGAANALNKVVKFENDNAFLQGQADYYAKTISEQSWLTADSYQQGRSLSEFSTGILDYQQRASELARASVQAGEDLNTFTQKLAPVLKGMNDKVAALGLTGEAKDTALKTVLTSVASAQKLYQKELENETIRNRELGANQLGTAAVVAGMQPGADSAVIAGNLDAVFQGTYQLYASEDPKNALSKASKKSLGAVKEIVTRLQASSTDDLNKLKMLSGYMQKATNWTTDERDAALNAIDSKFMEFEKFQDVYNQESVRTLETRVQQGDASIDDIRDLQSAYHSQIASGTLDPTKGNALLDNLHRLSLKADSEYGNKLLVTQGTYADVLKSGQGVEKVLNQKVAQLVDTLGDTSAAGVYLMRDSTRTDIPGEYKKGAELVAQGFQNFLNAPASSITEVQDTQANAVLTYATAWNQAADNPGQRDALIAALPKEWQGAMRQVLRSPEVDVTDMRQLKGALDKARDGIEQQAKAGFSAQFTPDTFKSTFFGDNGLQAKLFNQPTDALLMQYSREANANVLRNKEHLASKGHLIVDEESAAQALLQEGLAVRTASGPVFLNPEFKQSTGIENTEMLAKVFEQVKQEVSSKSGGRSKPENVRVVVTGGTATFIDYDDNNVPLRQYTQTPDDLNRRYSAWIEEQAATAPENILDSVRVGGPSGVTLNVTRPWGSAFMSNDLGTKVAKHLARSEGWTPDWRNTRSAEGQADPNLKQVDVIGIGISRQDHPEWVERLDAAKGSPAKMSQVIGDFAGEYFKTFPAYVKEAGIPQTFEFGRRPDAVYIGLADAMWHGGTTGAKQYAAAIKTASTDLEQAKRDLMSTAVYKQSGPERRKFLERGLVAAWMPRGSNANQ